MDNVKSTDNGEAGSLEHRSLCSEICQHVTEMGLQLKSLELQNACLQHKIEKLTAKNEKLVEEVTTAKATLQREVVNREYPPSKAADIKECLYQKYQLEKMMEQLWGVGIWVKLYKDPNVTPNTPGIIISLKRECQQCMEVVRANLRDLENPGYHRMLKKYEKFPVLPNSIDRIMRSNTFVAFMRSLPDPNVSLSQEQYKAYTDQRHLTHYDFEFHDALFNHRVLTDVYSPMMPTADQYAYANHEVQLVHQNLAPPGYTQLQFAPNHRQQIVNGISEHQYTQQLPNNRVNRESRQPPRGQRLMSLNGQSANYTPILQEDYYGFNQLSSSSTSRQGTSSTVYNENGHPGSLSNGQQHTHSGSAVNSPGPSGSQRAQQVSNRSLTASANATPSSPSEPESENVWKAFSNLNFFLN